MSRNRGRRGRPPGHGGSRSVRHVLAAESLGALRADGVRISGRRPNVSGCEDAAWIAGTCVTAKNIAVGSRHPHLNPYLAAETFGTALTASP
jgi:hypothetical protein